MLPSEQRLRRSVDFQAVTKHGRRRKSGELVAYLLKADVEIDGVRQSNGNRTGPRAGLIVGKAVGNSVARHRVSRRLREQLRHEISGLASGDRVVVRALSGAARRSSAQIGQDLSAAMQGLRRSAGSRRD